MLGTVNFDAGGRSHKLRLTTRAGCQLEELLGMSYAKLMQTVQDEFGFRFAVAFFTAALADGKGVDRSEAVDVIDDLGLERATELIGQALGGATPEPTEAPKGKPAGNAKRAG